jgi:hypothetical protein
MVLLVINMVDRGGGHERAVYNLSHPNTDIATSLIHVWMEWFDTANATAAVATTTDNETNNPEEEELKNIQAITQFAERNISGQHHNGDDDDDRRDSSLLELLIGN